MPLSFLCSIWRHFSATRGLPWSSSRPVESRNYSTYTVRRLQQPVFPCASTTSPSLRMPWKGCGFFQNSSKCFFSVACGSAEGIERTDGQMNCVLFQCPLSCLLFRLSFLLRSFLHLTLSSSFFYLSKMV